MMVPFVAVHESPAGTKPTSRVVRPMSAFGRTADVNLLLAPVSAS